MFFLVLTGYYTFGKSFISNMGVCNGGQKSARPSEAATRGALCKKVFLEISQNSQENNCARVCFLIKLQARPATLLKKGSGTGVFLWILWNF